MIIAITERVTLFKEVMMTVLFLEKHVYSKEKKSSWVIEEKNLYPGFKLLGGFYKLNQQ